MNCQNTKYRVLFIGNSYTYFHSLWLRFQGIAETEGFQVSVDSVTKGGYTLSQMNTPTDVCGKKINEKLTDHAYDIVIIQEQSLKPAQSPEKFCNSVGILNEKIRKIGAKPILYQTWGRKEGHDELIKNEWTPKEMTDLIAAAYRTAGEKYDIPVAPVGTAFYDVTVNHPEIELYHTDLTHPSAAGTYLAALCLYATAFGKSPVGVKYIFGVEHILGSDQEQPADILQKAARRAVFGEDK